MTLKADVLTQIRAEFDELMKKREALSDEERAVLDARIDKALRSSIESLKVSDAYTEPNKTPTWEPRPLIGEDVVFHRSARLKDFPLPTPKYPIHGD